MGQPETSNSGGGVRSEIAFFDVETTIPFRSGQKYAILEFGAILVCPKNLTEIGNYSTLVHPGDLSLITKKSVNCNGIKAEDVVSAPLFRDIADGVYDILHGRIWAGHNIIRFDCARIREAFAEVGRSPPEPRGIIDSLALLTERFGRRAGNMKMATLAAYFGLGQQAHRSLDDVRLNLEVLKHCATVLFLESSLPDILTENSLVSPNATARSRRMKNSSPESSGPRSTDPSSSRTVRNDQTSSPQDQGHGESQSIVSLLIRSESEVSDLLESNAAESDPFDMSPLGNEVKVVEVSPPDVDMEEKPIMESPQTTSSAAVYEGCAVHTGFLEPDEVSIPSIRASLVPFYREFKKIQLFYENMPLQLSCAGLKVRFGISTKFVDYAGRPRLSFVVDASPSLCRVLDACDSIVQKQSLESGSCSDWRPVVSRKEGYVNKPTVRFHIPTVVNGDSATYSTEIYQKEPSGVIQKLLFTRFDPSELDSLLRPGTMVDACISLDPYDYQQNAGIRLVVKKLIVN